MTTEPRRPEPAPPESRRLRAALLATLGFGVALCIACCVVLFVMPFAGTDAFGWLLVAMIVAAAAGFLAVLLRMPTTPRARIGILLPALGACASFFLAGGVLTGLGSGDPLKGPPFALEQFRYPGIYLTAALAIVAAVAFRMGTSPHRDRPARPIG